MWFDVYLEVERANLLFVILTVPEPSVGIASWNCELEWQVGIASWTKGTNGLIKI